MASCQAIIDYLCGERSNKDDLRLSNAIGGLAYTDIETINEAVVKVRSRLVDPDLQNASAAAEFGIVQSPVFGACVITRGGTPHIEINVAIPQVLTLLNICVLSFLDASDDAAGKAFVRQQMVEDVRDVLLRLLDPSDQLGDLRFRGRWQPNGFLRSFGFPEKSMTSAPLDLMRDHQLEFILLHEIAHVAAEAAARREIGLPRDLDSFSIEFEADRRAIIETRRLWAEDAHHTSFCEAMQLVLFLYLDIVEFMESALASVGRRMIGWFDMPWPTRRDTHPPALARFERALAVVAPPGIFSRMFLDCFEDMLARLKISLVTGAVDGAAFFRLARVAAHWRLQQWMAESGEFAPLVNKLVIAARDSQDLVLGRGANSSVWFPDEDPNVVEATFLMMKKARPFAKALRRRVKPTAIADLKEEMERALKLRV